MYKDSYQQFHEAELKVIELQKEYADLKKEVEELINELEVESFLLDGPGGIDP